MDHSVRCQLESEERGEGEEEGEDVGGRGGSLRTPRKRGEGKGDVEGGGAAFLNLRPPSDSPARSSITVDFDLPPAVERFSLPLPTVRTQVDAIKHRVLNSGKKSSNGGKGSRGRKDAMEDEQTRKRPRESSSPDHQHVGHVGTKRDRSKERRRGKQPLKKRIETMGSPENACEKTIAVIHEDFDPITHSHLQLAAEILHSDSADEVWLLPTSEMNASRQVKTPSRERWLMCHVAVNSTFPNDFPIRVESLVMDNVELTTLPQIYATLKGDNPNVEFRFVVSSNDLEEKKKEFLATPSRAAGDVVGASGDKDDEGDDETNAGAVAKSVVEIRSKTSAPPLLIVPAPGFASMSQSTSFDDLSGESDALLFDADGQQFPPLRKASAIVKQRMRLAHASNFKDVSLASGDSGGSQSKNDKVVRAVRSSRRRVPSRCEGLLPVAVLAYVEKYRVSEKYF
eukprot:g2704.t1